MNNEMLSSLKNRGFQVVPQEGSSNTYEVYHFVDESALREEQGLPLFDPMQIYQDLLFPDPERVHADVLAFVERLKGHLMSFAAEHNCIISGKVEHLPDSNECIEEDAYFFSYVLQFPE